MLMELYKCWNDSYLTCTMLFHCLLLISRYRVWRCQWVCFCVVLGRKFPSKIDSKNPVICQFSLFLRVSLLSTLSFSLHPLLLEVSTVQCFFFRRFIRTLKLLNMIFVRVSHDYIRLHTLPCFINVGFLSQHSVEKRWLCYCCQFWGFPHRKTRKN